MKPLRRAISVLGVFAVLFTVTACGPAGGDPAPTEPAATMAPSNPPSESPTPSATPVVHPSAVIVDGDSVSVKASEGGIYLDIPFTTDPSTAVAQLNEAINSEAITSALPASGCFPERQQATWGGLSFIWGSDWQRAPDALFYASVTGPETANGIKVTLTTGQWVGASSTEVLAANPSAPTVDFGAWINLSYDVASGTADGDPDGYYGAYALLKDGVLKSFASPIMYNYDC